MSSKLNSIMTYVVLIGTLVMFALGLVVEVLPPMNVATPSMSLEIRQGLSQAATAFMFAIGWLILCLVVGIVVELAKTPPKPQDTTEDSTEK